MAHPDRFLLAGVMGWPVMHSRSPMLHNHWFAAHRLAGAYVPLAISPAGLERALRALPALGFVGCNLTIPHKETAFRMFQSGASVAQVAAKTERASSTITEYLAEFIEREKPADIDAWVPAKVYREVAAAAMEVPTQSLKPLFVRLGEKVPYDQLRLVVAHLRSRNKL